MPGDDIFQPAEPASPATPDEGFGHPDESPAPMTDVPDPEVGGSSPPPDYTSDEGGSPDEPPQDGLPQPDQDPGSLNSGEQDPTQQPQIQAQPGDEGQPSEEASFRERYSDIRRYLDRKERQWAERQEELQQLRQQRKEWEQQAQRQNLPSWSRQHPDYPKFAAVKSKINNVRDALRNLPDDLPPEARDAARHAILSQVSPEDQETWQSYQQEREQFAEQFFEDPYPMLMPMVRSMAQEVWREAEHHRESAARVEQDFQDPDIQQVIQQHGEDFAKALNDGVPYNYATHMARMFRQLETYREQVQELQGKVQDTSKEASQARERNRLLKGKASITRDVSVDTSQDPYQQALAEAEKRGVDLGSPAFVRILEQFTPRDKE